MIADLVLLQRHFLDSLAISVFSIYIFLFAATLHPEIADMAHLCLNAINVDRPSPINRLVFGDTMILFLVPRCPSEVGTDFVFACGGVIYSLPNADRSFLELFLVVLEAHHLSEVGMIALVGKSLWVRVIYLFNFQCFTRMRGYRPVINGIYIFKAAIYDTLRGFIGYTPDSWRKAKDWPWATGCGRLECARCDRPWATG